MIVMQPKPKQQKPQADMAKQVVMLSAASVATSDAINQLIQMVMNKLETKEWRAIDCEVTARDADGNIKHVRLERR